MNPFVERQQDKISGVLSCFDRVVITGTLPDIGYAGVCVANSLFMQQWASEKDHCSAKPGNNC